MALEGKIEDDELVIRIPLTFIRSGEVYQHAHSCTVYTLNAVGVSAEIEVSKNTYEMVWERMRR